MAHAKMGLESFIKKLDTTKAGGQDLSVIVGTLDQCQASK